MSIYVNPTQFGPTEDLSRYPRDLARDARLCRKAGVDVVFAPGDEEMYPDAERRTPFRRKGKAPRRAETEFGAPLPAPFSTYVAEESLSHSMEGVSRPTHFRGVTTVVAKLFNIVQPDLAVFGAKDYQQAAIIKRMVRDLNFPLKIAVAPTQREPDGLALSSRNKYLEGDLRRQALALSRAIQKARAALRQTARPIPAARFKARLKQFIEREPDARLDYIECFDPDTLVPLTRVARGAHLALAVFIGKTRLIDNGRL